MIIYLHCIDIDEFGRDIPLPVNINQYILKYSFVFDQVLLQASSALKRTDAYNFFMQNQDLFKPYWFHHVKIKPRISFTLSQDTETYEHYIEDRYEILYRQKGYNVDSEFLRYESNNAIKKARVIDSVINKQNIFRKVNSVDKSFRMNTALFSSKLNVYRNDLNVMRVKQYLIDHALKNETFQTFNLITELSGRKFNYSKAFIGKLGYSIRQLYYQSNAFGSNASYMNHDWHFEYNNLNQLIQLIGLERLFRYKWSINREIIERIKAHPSFKSLVNFYFSLNELAYFERINHYCYYHNMKNRLNHYKLLLDHNPYLKSDVEWVVEKVNSLNAYISELKSIAKYHEEL